MVPLFIGLMAANLLLLTIVFGMGLLAIDGAKVTGFYSYHIAMGIAAGMMTLAAHLIVYTYFMATTKWLGAAADKAGLDTQRFVTPALVRKGRCFRVAMSAVVLTMLTMFTGAGADPTAAPLWPGEVHMVLAAAALTANVLCALLEYQLIRGQSQLMDEALAVVNATPGVTVEQS